MKRIQISRHELDTWMHESGSAQYSDSESRKRFWQARKAALSQEPKEIPHIVRKALSNADRCLFMEWRPKISGNIGLVWAFVLITLILEVFYLYFSSLEWPKTTNHGPAFIFLFLLSFSISIVIHPLSHYFSGKILGIHFQEFFLAPHPLRKTKFPLNRVAKLILTPGVKYDLESMLSASKWKRAAMLASGVVLPYLLLYGNLIMLVINSSPSQPEWIEKFVIVFIVAWTIAEIATSWFFHGDLAKARDIYRKRPVIELVE